jgi:hypothetical protein
MNSTVEHTDVGAYALELLNDDDRRAFEAHLSTCEPCQAEVADFAGMRDLLSLVKDQETPEAAPEDQTPETAPDEQNVIHMLRRRRTDARRHRRRTSLLMAAAAVILVAGGATAGSALTGHRTDMAMPGMPGTKNGPANQLMLVGERHPATNPATGVSGTVALMRLPWGTHVGLELSKVSGPLECELVAVSKTGTERVVTGWSVPPAGYGTPAHRDPLDVHGGTSISRDQLARLDVRAIGGETLLSVPV